MHAACIRKKERKKEGKKTFLLRLPSHDRLVEGNVIWRETGRTVGVMGRPLGRSRTRLHSSQQLAQSVTESGTKTVISAAVLQCSELVLAACSNEVFLFAVSVSNILV